MDIRTKLVIVLVGVSLGSMWLLGFFAFQTSASLLKEISERQLDALAESKARDVEKVIASWADRVSLVCSRTQLRIYLNSYNRDPDELLIAPMRRIIRDAQVSTPNVVGIALYDAKGRLLASTGETEGSSATLQSLPKSVTYVGASDLRSRVRFSGPLMLEGQQIGALAVHFDRGDLVNVTADYTGLGELGETIIAKPTESGIVVLHPLRHEVEDPIAMNNTLVQSSLDGLEQTFMGTHSDYRGGRVWGATRHIDAVDWGLTVQVDVDEERQREDTLRDSMIDLALSLSAFAILVGTFLGFYLAKPIRELAETVKRVRHGEANLRADTTSEDEVGELARALNEFLDQGSPSS